ACGLRGLRIAPARRRRLPARPRRRGRALAPGSGHRARHRRAQAPPGGRLDRMAEGLSAAGPGRDHRRLTVAAVTRFRAVAAVWHAALAGPRMLAMSGPRPALIAARCNDREMTSSP